MLSPVSFCLSFFILFFLIFYLSLGRKDGGWGEEHIFNILRQHEYESVLLLFFFKWLIKSALVDSRAFYLPTVAWLSFDPVTRFRKDFKWRKKKDGMLQEHHCCGNGRAPRGEEGDPVLVGAYLLYFDLIVHSTVYLLTNNQRWAPATFFWVRNRNSQLEGSTSTIAFRNLLKKCCSAIPQSQFLSDFRNLRASLPQFSAYF